MTSESKHLMTINHLKAIPYDELHRYELIEGKLYVSCAPGISHQLLLSNLQFELGNYLSKNPIGRLIPGPGVVLSQNNSVIPDAVYVCNERWKSIATKHYFKAAPDLVFEILSSGPTYFRDLKRQLYGKYGVSEYWVVDRWSRAIMIFRLKDDKLIKITTFKENDVLEMPLFPEFSVKVGKIFLQDFQD